nr:ribonuclease H-like domain-containing protein [Tanacetum cinerariifolium]
LSIKEKMESQSETIQIVSALKLPMLKTRDYDLWSMRMKQYLTHTDYALWEVIVNGDAPIAISLVSGGVEATIPPKTTAEKIAMRNELKAKRKSVLNNEGKATGQRKVKPVWNNAKRVNHQNFSNNLTHPHPRRNFVPTAVITNSGKVPVNAAKQSSPRAATSTSTAKYVNTAANKPTVNGIKPSLNVFHKSHSPARRTFNQRTAPKHSDLKEKINNAGTKAVVSVVQRNEENVVKSLACWILRPTGNVINHIFKDSGSYMLKRFNYVDLQGRLKSAM